MNKVKQGFFRAPLLVVFSLSLLLFGCKAGDGGKESMKPPTPALPVMRLSLSDATVKTNYSAMLEGKVNVEIRPQVDGLLQNILVDEGAFVKAGQPLFKIDDRTYREQYNSALGSQHAAEARLAIAKIDEEKLVPLVENKVVSEIQLKAAKANAAAALAALEQAKATARSAALNLDDAIVKAPVSGYVGKIPLRRGSLVSKNQINPLTLLTDVSEIYAYFSMSEIDFIRFRQQYAGNSIQEKLKSVAPVSLVMAGGETYSEKGRLGTVSGQFDQATGSVRIRAVFPNPHALLRSGNTGDVVLESLSHDVLVVPQASTVELQDKIFVFLLGPGNKVKRQVITVAGKSGNNYIVSSGLKAGDTIVTIGVDKLKDGALIKPVAGAPAAAPSRP